MLMSEKHVNKTFLVQVTKQTFNHSSLIHFFILFLIMFIMVRALSAVTVIVSNFIKRNAKKTFFLAFS